MEEAKTKKGMIWILEMLVFVLVFYIASFVQGLVLAPVQFKALMNNSEYMAAVQSADTNAIIKASMKVSQQLASSDWYILIQLFSEILIIAAVFIFCRFIQKRKFRSLGFVNKDVFKSYGIGMILGFVFFSVCVGLSVLFGGLKFNGVSSEFVPTIFILYLFGYMVQGMAEEVLCRGYFMGSYARRYPAYAAVLANALLFAALHLMNPGITVLAFINLTLFGIFASLYYIRGGNIWGIGAFHSVWNLVQGNFYGIQVSGLPLGNTLFSTTSVEGKTLLNGGSFGMEGSLICTIVYVAGIVWLLTRKNKDEKEETKRLEAQAEA